MQTDTAITPAVMARVEALELAIVTAVFSLEHIGQPVTTAAVLATVRAGLEQAKTERQAPAGFLEAFADAVTALEAYARNGAEYPLADVVEDFRRHVAETAN